MIQPISIDIASLNLASLLPMLIAVGGALIIICIDLMTKNLDRSFYIMLTVLVLLLDLGSVFTYSGGVRGFFDVMLMDGIALLSQMVIIIGSGMFILLALSRKTFHEYKYPEYFALFLFMTAGFQFMVSSDNLILIFVGLETGSMALYTMIAMHNRDKSTEAAIKYFTMGALAAAFFAFGSMVFYGLTGSVELGKISEVLTATDFDNYAIVLVGIVFILAALGFKLTLVPFQTWAPDVYDGSNAALAGYIAVVPKIAAFVVALRFFEIFVSIDNAWVDAILYTTVVATMTLANIMALAQTDVKRMLGYSSISHAGFVMTTILIGTTQATQGMFIYWILFAFTNLGAFAMLWVNTIKNHDKFETDHPFERYSGLIKKSPLVASMMGLFMLSNAGIPPFALFWGKIYIIGAAVNAGYIVLALIMALNSAVAVYFYLKLIVYMFLKDPIEDDSIKYLANSNTPLKLVVSISAFVTITSIIFIQPIIDVVSYYVQISGF